MPPLTYFTAKLKCPHCGVTSEVSMQNKLLYEFGENTLRVGDHRDSLTTGDFESAFFTLRLPKAGEKIHVLEVWSCPNCHRGNWAEVVFRGQTVESIETVALSRETLNHAHFVTETVDEDYERVVGESMWTREGVRPNFIETLKQHLPAA